VDVHGTDADGTEIWLCVVLESEWEKEGTEVAAKG
jgi:hypothetical protein